MIERLDIEAQQLYTGSCMDVLPMLPAKSVHVCVTSPPYFALRSYLPDGHTDKCKEIGSEPAPEAFIATMVAVFREVRRVLRDDGVLWVNLGDSYCDTTKWGGARGCKNVNSSGPRMRPSFRRDRAEVPRAEGGQLQNIPHRVAEALRRDGWIWRQTIVWAKRSPMPESLHGWRWIRHRVGVHEMQSVEKGQDSDTVLIDCPGCDKCRANAGYILRRGSGRCTTAHEYIFLFAKTHRYFWDGEASKEAAQYGRRDWGKPLVSGTANGDGHRSGAGNFTADHPETGLNPRSVWTLSSEPTSQKHFATFPSELVRRCLASSPAAGGVCAACGAPFAPVVESERMATRPGTESKVNESEVSDDRRLIGFNARLGAKEAGNRDPERHVTTSKVSGYRPTCACGAEDFTCPVCGLVPSKVPLLRNGISNERKCPNCGSCLVGKPARRGPVILDCFAGIGTVAQTARHLSCRGVYIDLNQAYVEIAKTRILEPPRWWLRQQAGAGRPVKINREPLRLFQETT